MKSHEKLLFDILQSELWGRPFDREVEKDDLKRAMKLASSHAVLGLVGNVIMTTPHLKAMLSEQEYAVLRKFIVGNLATGKVHNNNLVKIVMELRKSGIEPVLLKGLGLARFYPHPECRQLGDLDIYVGEENFKSACQAVISLTSSEDSIHNLESLKHFETKIGKTIVEIHRFTDLYFPNKLNQVYQEISAKGTAENIVSVEFEGVPVYTPSVTFNAFYVFSHFWHHFIGEGVGLRQICDWVVLLHNGYGKIDLNELKTYLVRMKLLKQWLVFGHIAVDVFGLPENEFPFYEKRYKNLSIRVRDLVLVEGNFGKLNLKGYDRPEGYYSGKAYSFRKKLRRNFKVMTLFPKSALLYLVRVTRNGVAAVFKDKF